MQFNRVQPFYTHEGARAKQINPYQQLRRSVLSCLLWEKEFYEDGVTIAQRIMETAAKCGIADVATLAIEARHVHGLRHVPLLLLLDLIQRGNTSIEVDVGQVIAKVIERPDEMGELLALYWREGKRPLSKQLKLGLAGAFAKFNEYQLAKYDRDSAAVKLRDVLRLVRPKPENDERSVLYHKVRHRLLTTPDTWEVALSGGADKREAWTRLLAENKLGYMALLRNLRNMEQAGVDFMLVDSAIRARRGDRYVLPFRYVAAARAAPRYEAAIDYALCAKVAESPPLLGATIVLVDVSYSMEAQLSHRSDLRRIDAAAALASVVNAPDLRVMSFSEQLLEVPARRGMAGVDAVINSQTHRGTYMGRAIEHINRHHGHDRLIVITDEQTADRVPDPQCKHAYMINVASANNGVGYGRWTHLDGFSESVIRFIQEVEAAR